MNIVIKKASIRNGLFLNYEFEQKDTDVNNTIKTQSDAPIHEDLHKGFRKLIPHFALITEEISVELAKMAIDDPEEYLFKPFEEAIEPHLYKFHVNEFSVLDKKGLNFVSLSRSKTLATKDSISFSTYLVDLDNLTDYKFVQELSYLVDELKREVLLYMEGKQAPRKQLEMFSEEDQEDQEGVELTITTSGKDGKTKKIKTTSKSLKKASENISAFDED
jgi:hypothetical protein